MSPAILSKRIFGFFSSRRRHTRCSRDWSSDVCSSDLVATAATAQAQSANINVTANVFQALTVVGNSNLDFGNVFPGVNKTIGVADAGAGKYSVTVRSEERRV